jgi:nucleoside-diphosphate-sugar epimerase
MTMSALKGQDLTLYNDGTQIRSWCYISDFISGMSKAIFGEDAKNHVFNIGNPQATTTILGLAEKIIAMTNSKSKIVFKKHPGPEVELRIPDITKAATLLSYQPVVDLTYGLTKTIAWFKDNIERL